MKQKDKDDFKKSILDVASQQTSCTCECHVEGMNVMHMMPCCDRTYEKFK